MLRFCKLTQAGVSFCLLHSAGDERARADHWLAGSGGLCRQLVWKGEVSTVGADPLTKQYSIPFFFAADWQTRACQSQSHFEKPSDWINSNGFNCFLIKVELQARENTWLCEQPPNAYLNGSQPFQCLACSYRLCCTKETLLHREIRHVYMICNNLVTVYMKLINVI